MQRQKVDSSNIESIGYDVENEVLEIEFKSSKGEAYQYEKVDCITYKELMEAQSLGSFFAHRIRGKFEHKKITVERRDIDALENQVEEKKPE